MAFDYKKEYKEYYLPKNKPSIINIPAMNFIAVRGEGDPNESDGEYKAAMSMLYSLAFTLKMSYKTDYKINGYFEYVVPPLEGFWFTENGIIDYKNKAAFKWISVIRLPEFITEKDFSWAKETAEKKKGIKLDKAEFITIDEGICVQMMHIGSYDNEPESIALMNQYIKENGYVNDISQTRLHHEIYLSDPRRVEKEKLKTVLRHPIKKIL